MSSRYYVLTPWKSGVRDRERLGLFLKHFVILFKSPLKDEVTTSLTFYSHYAQRKDNCRKIKREESRNFTSERRFE